MREARAWRALMGLENTVVEGVVFDDRLHTDSVHPYHY